MQIDKFVFSIAKKNFRDRFFESLSQRIQLLSDKNFCMILIMRVYILEKFPCCLRYFRERKILVDRSAAPSSRFDVIYSSVYTSFNNGSDISGYQVVLYVIEIKIVRRTRVLFIECVYRRNEFTR